MKIKELPLILFTIMGQAAVGVSVLSTSLLLTGDPPGILDSFWIPITSITLLIMAFIASIFHMGHPLGSIRTLANLKNSWLSREILLFGLYALLLFTELILRFHGQDLIWISVGVSMVGIAALFASAMIYISPGFPAMNNPVPALFFFSTASVLGPCVLMLIPRGAALGHVVIPYLEGALMLGGLMHLLVPSIWRSGGPVLKHTANRHFGSFVFWIRLLIGFFLPLVFLMTQNTLPLSGIILIAAGELLGRWLFFNRMTHASDHIGQL